jgi:3-deoxy-D-manno-octulosonic-acid transferase
MIAPRHPQRFDAVARIAAISGLSTVRRSQEPNPADAMADVVILDSIGELRSVYPLATLVFCGGSLIPHGGQSMLEPASEGKPIVTGFHTYNFANAVEVFAFHDAIVTLPELGIADAPSQLSSTFYNLISNPELMMKIGTNAKEVMDRNRGASEKTLDALRRLLGESE